MQNNIFFLLVLVAVFATGPASGDQESVPDYALSYFWRSYEGPEILTLMIDPQGSGPYFNQARLPDGNIADGTINLVLLDPAGEPIFGYPREDIWLLDETSPLRICGFFELLPDSDTDRDGWTAWFQRPRGGGYTTGSLQVYVNGSPLAGASLLLRINSPDIDADLRVSLSDVVQFSEDYFGDYHFRSDLHHDGFINLSDVNVMAEWVGRSCATQ